MSVNSFGAKGTLRVGEQEYEVFRLASVPGSSRLPFTHKVLLENLLRTEDGANVTRETIEAIASWDPSAEPADEIQFTPARVVMQDFTGVPVVVDLATMREAVAELGGDPARIEPLAPSELVIDHSVIADFFGTADAEQRNVELEYERNRERYQFLRWGQGAFEEFKVVPPGTGIVHQVNIEHLARVIMARRGQAYPDTVVGTDSHTTMVNGLGVLGWGVGGIEAEAAMLGQPVSMLIPRVVGFKLVGELPQGATATDLVLTITEMLRRHGVVGKFVEFYGRGVAEVPLANRATLGNMSPEYGSTVAIFPIDEATIGYLRLTGRSDEQIALVEAYAKEQGLWHDAAHEPVYSEYLELDLSTVVPSLAGPKRPQDRVLLSASKESFRTALGDYTKDPAAASDIVLNGESVSISHGIVAIASITSCTNTSNPSVMMAAGLLARNAVERGLQRKPWVKTTLAPGSKVVTDYYEKAGLTPYLDKLGFDVVGYGCTTCIGNSGPLIPAVSAAVNEANLAVVSVLSGNRNFEGRISPDIKMNYLASPPLVVAYAIAGTMDIDLATEPLGVDPQGAPVFLSDIWPSAADVQAVIDTSIDSEMYSSRYADVFLGDDRWQSLQTPDGNVFEWDPTSTYVRKPPYFDGMSPTPSPVSDITGARVLLKLGDSVTTDHISPAGSIKADSPAGEYLLAHGVARADFNSYGSRRGNHEVMIRGTFANIRLRNRMLNDVEGGFTVDFTTPDDSVVPVYDAAMAYASHGTRLVILAGKEYGSGSSR
ncbi:MAG: aconitate hydratase AcnA, partial [Actinobacteria bacterium]|nr:aconitate hydratase AcnA [Actinomycetota bacterium]